MEQFIRVAVVAACLWASPPQLMAENPDIEAMKRSLEAQIGLYQRMNDLEQRVTNLEQKKGGDLPSTPVVTPSTASGSGAAAEAATPSPAPESSSRRYTRAELARQAFDYANRQRFLQATVNPPNQVWNHLKQDHGFTAEQVDGLTFNQALWVHSGAHTGVITAWTGKPAMAVQIKPSGHWERRCVNGVCRMYWIAH